MTTSTTAATNVLAGLDLTELADLSSRQRDLIAVILARTSERSYRRGVQQGARMASEDGRLRPDLHGWRYTDGLDASPGADSNRVETSLERLLTENPGLSAPPLRLPEEVHGGGLGKVDAEDAARRLTQLGNVYRAAWLKDAEGRSMDTLLAAAALRAFAMELMVLGGSQAMSDAFDDVVDLHGWEAVAGVSGVWTGIGGWSS